MPLPPPRPPGYPLDGVTSAKLRDTVATGDNSTWKNDAGDPDDRGGKWDYMRRPNQPAN